MMIDESPFRYSHAEIRTQVIVICGPMHYQLDHICAPNQLRYNNRLVDDNN